jgi:hypothetical protein
MLNKTYRCYCFGNYYLSSIQQGIQAAHAITNMFVKYKTDSDHIDYYEEALFDWAQNDRTMVCLNGGNSEELSKIENFLKNCEGSYSVEPLSSCIIPWSSFNEDKQSLNNALTSIACIVPESLYDKAKIINNRQTKVMWDEVSKSNIIEYPGTEIFSLNYYELEFLKILNSCRLAN